MGNPLFLQRCLSYKIQEKHRKRIQMTVYLPRAITGKNNVFPMYICLARRVSDGTSMDNAVYKIGRLFIFRNSPGVGLNSEIKAKFILPEVNRLAREAKSGTLDLWFVSTATVEAANSSLGEVNSNLPPLGLSHLPLVESGEYCLLGKVSLESLYMAWNYFPSFRLGKRAEFCTTVDLFPCIMKCNFINGDASISIQLPSNLENMNLSKELYMSISAEEFGVKKKSSGPSMPRQ